MLETWPWNPLPGRGPDAWLAALTVLVVAVASPALAAPGDLDTTFGVGGTLRTNFGGTYNWAYAVAAQPDGAVIAAGVSNAHGTHDFAVARYTPDRDLDPSFGDHGTVTTDFGDSLDWAYALALQPDGKIVVGGVSDRSGSKDFALARYHADGRLDDTFGDGGLVTSDLRKLTAETVRGLVVAPDGRIVAAGPTAEEAATLRPQADFMVAGYTATGDPDPSFGIAGVMTTDFDDQSFDVPYALVRQPDGRLLLGGFSNSGGGPGILFGADQLALARYTEHGLLDDSFGRGGVVTLDAGTLDEEIRALALTPGGRIVAAGFTNGENRGDFMVARFRADGRVDHTFGTAGRTVTDAGSNSERLEAVALQPDGKIVAGGQIARQRHGDFAVLRYDADGVPDAGFGKGGIADVDFAGREDTVNALLLRPDGRVVMVGFSEDDFALARFTL